ncbi:uncharacterized protein LOC127877782 [Dreissena polymorpha]|uniref:uncharacterized protein LOC127877782 n=1 Tax=Dreissena polymorpha TaxID=45954 RepID=UPI00226488BC|nr:uncharacterized protein LOC127877782 [Dreissena polymorpha]
MSDHFTKYVEVFPVKTQTAEESVDKIVDNFISRWGTHLSINSDQGSAFESQLLQKMCSIFGIKKTRISPRNPKGNGQVEQFNRSLLKMIRAYLSVEQSEWDLHLGSIAGAYRATPHESTGLRQTCLQLDKKSVCLLMSFTAFLEPQKTGILQRDTH